MASPYAEVLNRASTRVQERAQAGVPVTPANGNPNGAYNMPQPAPQVRPALSSPFLQYSAANPSPFMQNIQEILNSYQAGQAATTVAPQVQQPAPNIVMPLRRVV